MISLQRLSLHLLIACDDVFIDPLDLIEQLTSGMSQLHSLNFYARAENQIDQPNRCSFSHVAERHEKRKRYGQVWDSVVRKCMRTYHHVFTLPFRSTQLMYIGRDFPETRFQHVVNLWVTDVGQFDHDFFLRLARCFPVLQRLLVDEETSILWDEPDDFPAIRCDQVVQYPYLKTLHLFGAGLCCIEQFLNDNITRLPRLTQLTIMHNKLAFITDDFTRQETRRNCAHVIKLVTFAIIAGSKDYYDHFSSLWIGLICQDCNVENETTLFVAENQLSGVWFTCLFWSWCEQTEKRKKYIKYFTPCSHRSLAKVAPRVFLKRREFWKRYLLDSRNIMSYLSLFRIIHYSICIALYLPWHHRFSDWVSLCFRR